MVYYLQCDYPCVYQSVYAFSSWVVMETRPWGIFFRGVGSYRTLGRWSEFPDFDVTCNSRFIERLRPTPMPKICLSCFLSSYLTSPFHLSVCSVSLYVCLSVWLSVCVCMTVCLSVCLSACLHLLLLPFNWTTGQLKGKQSYTLVLGNLCRNVR